MNEWETHLHSNSSDSFESTIMSCVCTVYSDDYVWWLDEYAVSFWYSFFHLVVTLWFVIWKFHSLSISLSISVANEWSIISMNHFLGSLNGISFCTWLRYTSILFYYKTNKQGSTTNQDRDRERASLSSGRHCCFCCCGFCWRMNISFSVSIKCTDCHQFIFLRVCLPHTHIHTLGEWSGIHWIGVPKKNIFCIYECVCDVFMNTHIPNETSLNRDRLTVSFELVVCTTIITIHRFAEHKILWLVQRSDSKFSRAIVLKQRRLSGGWWKFCRM